MTEITRRKALGITAAATVAAALPVVNAATAAPSPELLALYDDVRAVVDTTNADEFFSLAQYLKIFRRIPGTDGHCAKCDARLEDGVEFVHMRISQPSSVHDGQRFVYRIPHHEVELGCALLATSDEHEAANRKMDIKPTVFGLIKAFKECREIDAARMFNAPSTYDAGTGGDGRPLCSTEHPCDDAMWSNMGSAVLTGASLPAALMHIRASYVDNANLKIRARGTRLVVPVNLMDVAYRAMEEINFRAFPELSPEPMVWDYLENDRNWFVLTDIDGFYMSERRPFRMQVDMDPAKNAVIIMGDEKRGFGCSDQRAVFGSLPTA